MDLDVTARQKEKAIALFSNGEVKELLEWPVVKRESMDGIKLYLGEIGWVMVRASGTENLLRVYSETSKRATTDRVLKAVAGKIHEL
jgi:phosphomannomutase